jgi:ATP-dependent Clp protease ATP-binding subunit ClpC
VSYFYTEDARRVLSVAQRHALRLQHDTVGIELLVLALIEYGRGSVEEAFFALGVTPGEAWATWESFDGARPLADPVKQSPRSPEHTAGASRVLGLVFRERAKLRHSYIGCEHLLLALLRQLDDPWAEPELASEFFERLGVDLRQLRQELLSRIPTTPTDPP